MSAAHHFHRLLERGTYGAHARVRLELSQCQRNRFDEGEAVAQAFDNVVRFTQSDSQLRGWLAVGNGGSRKRVAVAEPRGGVISTVAGRLRGMSSGLLECQVCSRYFRTEVALALHNEVLDAPSSRANR